MATYLDAVNKVLKRLREPTVTTVIENEYSALIGDFVNDVKREAEDSWNWSALRNTITIDTSASIFNYELTDSNVRMRVLSAFNDTSDSEMSQRPGKWFDAQFINYNDAATGSPAYYNFNGTSVNGQVGLDVYPIPDGVYTLRLNVVLPQNELTADADTILIPYDIVVEGAVSRAMAERGTDGGNMDQEMRYRSRLSDYIAIDAGNREDEITWGAV